MYKVKTQKTQNWSDEEKKFENQTFWEWSEMTFRCIFWAEVQHEVEKFIQLKIIKDSVYH